MAHLVVNDTLVELLGQATGPTEIRGTDGRIVGFFTPIAGSKATTSPAPTVRTCREELERRKQFKDKGEPLAVVLHRLRLLEAEMLRRQEAGEKEFTTEEALAFFRALRQEGAAPEARSA